MKVSRKVISSLLIGSALLSFTGCSPKYDFSPKTLADYANNHGADEYDSPQEMFDDIISNDSDYFDTYAYSDAEDFEEFDYYPIAFKERADEMTVCILQDGESYAIINSWSFDQDDASDYYEGQKEFYEGFPSEAYEVLIADSPNLEYILFAQSKYSYIGIYHELSTNSVMKIDVLGRNEEDTKKQVDKICNDFGVVSPSTLLY